MTEQRFLVDVARSIAELRAAQVEAEKSRDYYFEGTTDIGNLDAALTLAEKLLQCLEDAHPRCERPNWL